MGVLDAGQGPVLIRIDNPLFTEKSNNLNAAMLELLPEKTEFVGAQTQSTVQEKYQEGLLALTETLLEYKALLEQDYAELQEIAEFLRSADNAGDTP